ncbi:MAG TPA: transcription termination/antitermination NusG family protein [Clostridia bacterium]|nr:transcription termination/antitermination NusG family protein [Clostridia bacterium]
MSNSAEWYAINTFIGKEKKVGQLIGKMGWEGIDVCCLSSILIEKKNSLIKFKTRPMFQGYIFIRGSLDLNKYLRIRELCDVIGFVSSGHMPVSVTDVNIIRLLDMAVHFPENAIPESRIKIVDGRIKIVDGPLMGYERLIIKTALRHRRIYLGLKLFGYSYKVTLPAMLAAN